MYLYILPLMCLAADCVLAPEAHETQALLEQYDQNAQRCGDVACSDEELDGLDTQLLMLLGRRAAVLRQRNHIVEHARRKGRIVNMQQASSRLVWLESKAKELSVPKAFSEPIMQALVRATENYEAKSSAIAR